MRRVLIEHARKKQSLKRGGDRVPTKLDESRLALDELLKHCPSFTLAFVRKYHLISDPDDMQHLLDGLRKAGVLDGT